MHQNVPFEFKIKEECKVTKVKELHIKILIIKSKKILDLIDEINF